MAHGPFFFFFLLDVARDPIFFFFLLDVARDPIFFFFFLCVAFVSTVNTEANGPGSFDCKVGVLLCVVGRMRSLLSTRGYQVNRNIRRQRTYWSEARTDREPRVRREDEGRHRGGNRKGGRFKLDSEIV